MFTHKASQGFTLIEIMLVVVIASFMVAMMVFGFDQTLNRRKSAAAEEVYQWLQAAADTSVFQTTVIGVTQNQNQLLLLAFYQDDWYRLADQEPLSLNEEIQLSWSDSLIRAAELNSRNADRGEGSLSPYVVIMPSGEIAPEGEIGLFEAIPWSDSLPSDEQRLAAIRWQNQGFELDWSAAQ